jgi:hypothetical protein
VSGPHGVRHPTTDKEHEKVRVTIEPAENWVQRTAGLIPYADPQLIEWAALDPELDYSPLPKDA